jgi:hypothetical protein
MTRISAGTTRCFVHSFTTGAALAAPRVRPLTNEDILRRARWFEVRSLLEQRDDTLNLLV